MLLMLWKTSKEKAMVMEMVMVNEKMAMVMEMVMEMVMAKGSHTAP